MKVKMKILPLVLLLIAAGIVFGKNDEDETNWVKNKTYFKPITSSDEHKSITTKSFLDGLGRSIQTQAKINTNGNYFISGTYTDVLGRDSITVKPFVYNTAGNFIPTKDFSMISSATTYDGNTYPFGANNYFNGSADHRPDAEDFAYTETQYWPDGAVKEVGVPGKEFSVDDTGHHIKSWHFIIHPGADTDLDAEGFIVASKLNEGDLDEKQQSYPFLEPVYKMIHDTGDLDDFEQPQFANKRYIIWIGQTQEFNSGDIIMWDDENGFWIRLDTPSINDIVYVMEKGRFDKGYFRFEDLAIDRWEYYDVSTLSSFFLAVTKNENDQYSQSLKDKFGRVIRSCSDTENGKRLVTKTKYDILDNILEGIPPDLDQGDAPDDYKTINSYNTLGQIVKKTTPDAGTVEYRYDKRGNLRYFKNALHKYKEEQPGNSKEYFFEFAYDRFNRLVYKSDIAVPEGQGTAWFDKPFEQMPRFVQAKRIAGNIYDAITSEELQRYTPDREEEIIEAIVTNLKNGKRRLVAEISFNINDKKVIDLYSYDSDGTIQSTFKLIPGVPAQKDSFEYDFTGEISVHYHYNGYEPGEPGHWKQTLKKEYIYDDDNRLEKVTVNGKKVVENFYTENSIKFKKSLFNTGSGNSVEEIKYILNLQDRLENIATEKETDLFNQQIYYHTTPTGGFASEFTPLYNGNISGIQYAGLADESNTYDNKLSYLYDRLGRLSEVYDGSSTGGTFGSVYDYDNMGRITGKQEGRHSLDDYYYTPKTNQLEYIPLSNKEQTPSGLPNYLYDIKGNMVLDRSKNMVIEYNWRDTPALFKFYDNIPEYYQDDPGDPQTPFAWNTLYKLDSMTDVNKLAEVEMVYDASGNRVQKLTYTYGE